jgi:hypothetical protein
VLPCSFNFTIHPFNLPILVILTAQQTVDKWQQILHVIPHTIPVPRDEYPSHDSNPHGTVNFPVNGTVQNVVFNVVDFVTPFCLH